MRQVQPLIQMEKVTKVFFAEEVETEGVVQR